MLIVWIAIFGAIGTLSRFAATNLLLQTTVMPLPTLFVNIVGSFLVGIVWGNSLPLANTPTPFMLIATTGFLGGFTTFSAFSLEVVRLAGEQKYGPALAYAIGSPVVCISMAAAGALLMRVCVK
jgi:CrcB protein